MRISRAVALLFLCALIPASLGAQQSTSTTPAQAGPQTPQAASFLQQAIAAQMGGAPVTDVTMTGAVTVVGSTTQSGTVTFIATSAGQGLATLTMPSGTRTEIRTASGGSQSLMVTGTDGTSTSVQTQSALSPHPGWFFPALILNSGFSSPDYASAYVGQETRNGALVQHLAVWLVQNSLSFPGGQLQQVSQQDLYLAPSSLLPVEMTFTVHPYDPTNPNRLLVPYRGSPVDLLEDVQFSDYQQVQGRLVALHIHTSIALPIGSVVSDTQLSSVSFNTGATVASN